jgi:hypothetical protein
MPINQNKNLCNFILIDESEYTFYSPSYVVGLKDILAIRDWLGLVDFIIYDK